MTDRRLNKLRKSELLQMLLELERENEQLAKQNRELQEQLQKRELAIGEAGSLADAAVRISGLLIAAQATADLYVENVKRQADERFAPGSKTCAEERP